MNEVQVAIIGAGPIGLELAVAFKQLQVDYLHLEARQIGHTISWYPRQVRFFSSADRIAIAGVPIPSADQSKPTGEDYLAYLRAICQMFDLQVHTFERVMAIRRTGDGFELGTERADGTRTYRARYVVVAVGDMAGPRRLQIPGQDLPHVDHYFNEPHRYFATRLLIVGGRNSAVEAAIRCQRAGARVALSYRRGEFDRQAVKYWLAPEIQMLIRTGQIDFYPRTVPVRIGPGRVWLRPVDTAEAAQLELEADFVLLLVGYQMDPTLFRIAGVKLAGPNQAPCFDADTMQTNVPGIFVAGTAAAGTQNRFRLFIENCHGHVGRIVKAITGRDCPFGARDLTTSSRYRLPET